jgi:hypothetical protein
MPRGQASGCPMAGNSESGPPSQGGFDWMSPPLTAGDHPAKRRITSAPFWPPKPKLVDTAVQTDTSRALFGT